MIQTQTLIWSALQKGLCVIIMFVLDIMCMQTIFILVIKSTVFFTVSPC